MTRSLSGFVFALACAVGSTAVVQAQTHIVQSRAGGLNNSLYSDIGCSNSTSQGCLPDIVCGIGSRIAFGLGTGGGVATYRFTPTTSGSYKIYATWVTSANGATSFRHTIEFNDPAGDTKTSTQVFMDQTTGGGQWNLLANTEHPAGEYALLAGVEYTVVQDNSQTGGSVIRCEAIKWELQNPCLSVPQVNVVGPLDEGQTAVTVTGASTDPVASDVKVYKTDGTNSTPISTGPGTHLGNGRWSVPVSTLVKGDKITATQVIGAQEGCVLLSGQLVGRGPNTQLTMTLGIRETGQTCPTIGCDGGIENTSIEWVGATSAIAGFNGAPQGKLLAPSPNWQTITFTPPTAGGTDPVLVPSYGGTGNGTLEGTHGVLREIGFSIAADPCGRRETGHFVVYIDQIMNGTTVVEDFESYDDGTSQVMFRLPKLYDPSSFLLAEPNVAVVDDAQAAQGTKSLRVEWQYSSTGEASWTRIATENAPGGRPNPLIDLTQPVTMRVLLLPLADDGTQLTLTSPDSQTVFEGDDATFEAVTTGGAGQVHYQWFRDGYPTGSDAPTLLMSDVTLEQSGSRFKVIACDANGTVYSEEFTLMVNTCHELRADADGDGDVDQEDFGVFQTCYTGATTATPVAGACTCFDRTGDGDVDQEDLNAFSRCVTGPEIPWSQDLTPECQP